MELATDEGQASADLGNETTAAAPDGSDEQSIASTQTTSSGPGSEDVESFFDPKDVIGTPNEAAYKQMQGEFTKRNDYFKGEQTKLDAYNAFLADPAGTIRALAPQYGLNLLQGQAPNQEEGAKAPTTWDEVYETAENRAIERLRAEFAPLNSEVQNLKQENVTTKLDRDYPDWRAHESNMSDMLQKHPSLVNDTDTLYRMSVPKELLEQRAMKSALAKVKGETDSAHISDNKTTSMPTTDKPTKPMSVEEAAVHAKAQLGSRGLFRVAEG